MTELYLLFGHSHGKAVFTEALYNTTLWPIDGSTFLLQSSKFKMQANTINAYRIA